VLTANQVTADVLRDYLEDRLRGGSFGTTVYLDLNGSASDGAYADVPLFDLRGVAANELQPGHFII
jgi:hypothetical protein